MMDTQQSKPRKGKGVKKTKTIQYEAYYGEEKTIKKDIKENVKIIRELFGDADDLTVRKVTIGESKNQIASVITIDGLTNGTFVQDFILKELMLGIRQSNLDGKTAKKESFLETIQKHSLPISGVEELMDFKLICEKLMGGATVVLFDGFQTALGLDTKGWADRGITEPIAESVVRGARDCFNETMRTNTMLVRRRIKDINLRVVKREVGRITKTDVNIMYIEGIANEVILSDLLSRIDLIDVDGILESSNIEELILDEPHSMFPTMYATERPDKVAGNLLEGRIAVIVDGTPFALILPAVFIQFFQAVEDYYHRSVFSTFIRLLRFLCFFLVLYTPAVYLAITTFHQEMLPTALLISISGQRESVPFPAVVEVLFMEFTFEILREAGLRMPRTIGSAISIVGALVLGEAAVSAGVVSSIMVIIVSITAISSLIFPDYNFSNPLRILRFIFIILAATLGLFGIMIGTMFLLLHLCGLRSFGVPYMYPLAPLNLKGLKDAFIRAPINRLNQRPSIMTGSDIMRQDEQQKNIKKQVKQSQEKEG
jgi:spore germination protein KA